MAAIHGVERLFLVAKRVVQFGVPIAVAAWAVLYVLLGGAGLPELMVLIGIPLILGAKLWFIAWIIEGFTLPRGERQH